MGIRELALFLAAQQLCQAVATYLSEIVPPPTNPWAAAALNVGEQLATNAAVACGAGVTAAYQELNATLSAQSSAASTLKSLPPIA